MKKGLWAEGTYLDLWSVVHTLSGVLAGVVALIFSLSFNLGLVVIFGLAVAWEGFERFIRIPETVRNRVADVVLGMAGFALSYDGLFSYEADRKLLVGIGAIVLAVLVVMNYLGRHVYFSGSRR